MGEQELWREARDAEVDALRRHAAREYVRGVNDGEAHGPGGERLAALRRVVEAARALVEAVDAGKAVADPLLAKPQIGKRIWNATAATLEAANRQTDEALAALRAALAEVTE